MMLNNYLKLIGLSSVLFLTQVSFALAGTDCTQVTEISATECETLLDLYNSTNGNRWQQNQDWNVTNTPCRWLGIACQNGHVVKLELPDNQLQGSLPDSLGNASSLKQINLSFNQLSGSLPDSLGNVSSLKQINLSFNQLSGSLPDSLGNPTSLEQLNLSFNQLSGSLPDSLGNLTRLQELQLNNNELSGSLPDSLGNPTSLKQLNLSFNQLSGSLPDSLGNLIYLQELYLNNNELNGSLPESWKNPSSLEQVDLSFNQFSGSIPESIEIFSHLQSLYLNNNEFCGEIPVSLVNLTKIRHLNLDYNHLNTSNPVLVRWLYNFNPTWASTQTPCSQLQVNTLPAAEIYSPAFIFPTEIKFVPPLLAEEPSPLPTEESSCLVYALHDEGLNDSQFFTINPEEDFEVTSLGDLHMGYDIEDMDIHPQTQELYVSSGDNQDAGYANGYIYQVNKENGELMPVCSTGLGEVSAISFHPNNHALWVWADNEGLFVIDLETIENGVCHKEEILPYRAKVEGIAWDNDGKILYGSEGRVLYQYVYDTGEVEAICDSFPSEVEALDMLADGSLLFALHKARDTSIYSFDISGCSLLDTVVIETSYTDIEGITWSCDANGVED